MKLKIITTSDKVDHAGWHILESSLKKHHYDYEHILKPFSFGHQLPIIRDWCNSYSGDCTHVLYTDCFDTVAFSDAEEVIQKFPDFKKMFISAEKACYPHPHRAVEYPHHLSSNPWKYVNGGGWITEIEYFKELCRKENLSADSHDQVWLMDAYLKNQDDIAIDTDCLIFQTIAFSYPTEWEPVDSRFRNIGTKTLPIFFHGNGHTDMNFLYEKS